MSNRYYYTWIRKDLTEAQRIIQTAHACYEIALRLDTPDDDTPSSMVLFEVQNQKELLKVAMFLNEKIPGQYHLFYEPDPLPDERRPMGYTAIATMPFEGDERELFNSFKMFKS